MNIKEIPTAQFSAISLYLTPKSLWWLNGITHGIPHMTIYRDLLFSMATSEMSIDKHGNDVPLKPLEVDASANGLAKRWNIGRKVMERLLKEMEELKLIQLSRSKLTSIATMTAVLDYDAIAPTSDNAPSAESQAEQQNVAQPSSGDDAVEAQSTVSTEAICDDGTTAPKVTVDPPSQASVPTDDSGSTDPINKPDGTQHILTQRTLFDGEEELHERTDGA